VPAFVRHQSLIRFSTRVCLCPNSGAIADIPQPPLRATFGLMYRKASVHSITLSARPSKGSGNVTPSVFAALRLTISSTLVICGPVIFPVLRRLAGSTKLSSMETTEIFVTISVMPLFP
jgi:hypothetical protein